MSKFTDHLWQDLAREHGPTLAHADRPEPGRAGRAGLLRRPRVLAGSTLGLAGVGAALLLALSGTAATAPAYAITQKDNGTVWVRFNYGRHSDFVNADEQLTAKYHEEILVSTAPGPATVRGPLNCKVTRVPGVPAPSGPAVEVLLGKDGTGAIPSGNTGAGTVHLTSCGLYYNSGIPGGDNTGNTGNG